MTYDTIKLAKDQGLATLTLNAPDKLNAVSRTQAVVMALKARQITV